MRIVRYERLRRVASIPCGQKPHTHAQFKKKENQICLQIWSADQRVNFKNFNSKNDFRNADYNIYLNTRVFQFPLKTNPIFH